ncbi:unnamed protein product [Brachionus calyciflorus]|uniref:Uncharacterized protein n=1 Tax=Brachionus calyciflorus TaxID=104777 RepID=A0A814GSP5_9BILA|nr:unnamed protein product [Brachionus calyciflorus]
MEMARNQLISIHDKTELVAIVERRKSWNDKKESLDCGYCGKLACRKSKGGFEDYEVKKRRVNFVTEEKHEEEENYVFSVSEEIDELPTAVLAIGEEEFEVHMLIYTRCSLNIIDESCFEKFKEIRYKDRCISTRIAVASVLRNVCLDTLWRPGWVLFKLRPVWKLRVIQQL